MARYIYIYIYIYTDTVLLTRRWQQLAPVTAWSPVAHMHAHINMHTYTHTHKHTHWGMYMYVSPHTHTYAGTCMRVCLGARTQSNNLVCPLEVTLWKSHVRAWPNYSINKISDTSNHPSNCTSPVRKQVFVVVVSNFDWLSLTCALKQCQTSISTW